MNRAELVEALAERSELTKAQTARLLDAVLEVITATIAAGEQVALIGFGTFKRALRAAREGRNPVSYTHLRAHETVLDLVCRLLLEKKKKKTTHTNSPQPDVI